MAALVFVTNELSPFTPGGIGRVIHNTLKSMSEDDRRRSYVLFLDTAISETEFSAVFPSMHLVRVDTNDEEGRFDANGHHPPRFAYSNSDWHWKSSVVFRALKTLARTVDIDYVEFPDWGALGFTSIQEKKISGFLEGACLAVRLHSAHTTLMQHEAYVISPHDLNLADIERKALRDCDRLIGQLAPVAEAMRQVFGFEPDEWEPRLAIHAPPVLLDTTQPVDFAGIPSASTPIMFGSKIQRFKRPDLFIRGVNIFCNLHPEYLGEIFLSAHSFDASYRDSVLKLVPSENVDRFHFGAPRTSIAREPLIAKSVFVVPSDFESYCLAAYEASLLGATVIVSDKNPAFGDGAPWLDGQNCIKFDGTALGLAKALERSFSLDKGLAAVTIPTCPWPWENTKPQKPEAAVKNDGAPLVTVLVPHFNLGSHLPATLTSILQQTYSNIEIIIVDDHSTDAASRDLIDNFSRNSRPGFKIITAPASLGLGAARNLGVASAVGKYLLPLDANGLLDRRFIEVAVGALERNPEFDVVVTPAAYSRDDEALKLPGKTENYADYAVFSGEALLGGFQQNRFSTGTAFFRTELFRQNSYRESLNCYEDWNLYLRLAQAGHRFLVTTDVYFFYRNRENSMVNAGQDPERHSLFLHDMLRTSADVRRMLPLAYTGLALHYSPPEPITISTTNEIWPFGLSSEELRRPLIFAARLQMLKFTITPILDKGIAAGESGE